MATRKALVLISGQVQELPTGDTLTGTGGGGSFPLTGTNYTQVTANYTTLAADETIEVTANSITITLIAGASAGFYQTIINTGLGIVTVQASGGGTVQGLSFGYLENKDSVTLVCKGSNIWIIK